METIQTKMELNNVIMQYLEELHVMCLESHEDMQFWIGVFPEGLMKISNFIDELKGKKTLEGVSVGKHL